jgi:hypothetical protein
MSNFAAFPRSYDLNSQYGAVRRSPVFGINSEAL